MERNEAKKNLIESLKAERILRTKSVEDALRNVKREDFLWDANEIASAYIDQPLSLGDTGQTISAPHMVAIMLEEADLSPGMRVLEIGTGSGYNAALIAHIVKGQYNRMKTTVLTVERDPRLVEFARVNLEHAGYSTYVKVIEGDGSQGYPQGSEEMLYDRIIVTAGATSVPPNLEKQLCANGILLMPVGSLSGQFLFKIRKVETGDGRHVLQTQKLMSVLFVPLVTGR